MTPKEASKQVTKSLKTNEYVACVINHWWLALVCDVNHDYKNVYSNFYPHGYNDSKFFGLLSIQFFRAI